MARLILIRTNEPMNLLRNYQVYVDGKQVGEIANGKTLLVDVTPGRHTLHSEIDWCASPTVAFELKENEEIRFKIAAFRQSRKLLLFALPLATLFLLSMFTDYGQAVGLVLLLPSVLLLGTLVYYMSFGRKNYLEITQLQHSKAGVLHEKIQ